MRNKELDKILCDAYYEEIKQELASLPSDEELCHEFPVTEEKRNAFIKRVYKKKNPIYVKYLRCTAVITLIVISCCLISYLYNVEYVSDIYHGDTATGESNSYIEAVEISNGEMSKIYKDRATVTLVTVCIKNILKNDFYIQENDVPVYTITLVDNKNKKNIYGLSTNHLFYNNKAYPIREEEYLKLLNYLK